MVKWIARHRPSPGTAFGLTALVIALGGAAFAAIPDSNGTIHGCYQKNNGSLRVVESASECRSSERAVSWAAGSQPGSGVVARATSIGPVTSIRPDPFSIDDGIEIPLSGATWTQRADETDQLYGVVNYTPPDQCAGQGGNTGQLHVAFYVNGEIMGGTNAGTLGGSSTRITADFGQYLYEPGSPVVRTLTARAADTCTDGNHYRIDSVKVSVFGIR